MQDITETDFLDDLFVAGCVTDNKLNYYECYLTSLLLLVLGWQTRRLRGGTTGFARLSVLVRLPTEVRNHQGEGDPDEQHGNDSRY